MQAKLKENIGFNNANLFYFSVLPKHSDTAFFRLPKRAGLMLIYLVLEGVSPELI